MAFRRNVQRRLRRATGEAVHRGRDFVQSRGAIHPGSARSERFGHLGVGCVIAFPAAALFGERGIHIGDDTLVAPWASLSAGYPGSDHLVGPRTLVIGDRCVIGLRCGITAHESIEIGDDVWLGQDVFITDANHGMDDPDVPIGRQVGESRPVRIGDGSWLGHGAVVLPGVTIGRHAVVAAGAVVHRDVSDHGIAAGVPARVVKIMHDEG